jgi:hypothetical protein
MHYTITWSPSNWQTERTEGNRYRRILYYRFVTFFTRKESPFQPCCYFTTNNNSSLIKINVKTFIITRKEKCIPFSWWLSDINLGNHFQVYSVWAKGTPPFKSPQMLIYALIFSHSHSRKWWSLFQALGEPSALPNPINFQKWKLCISMNRSSDRLTLKFLVWLLPVLLFTSSFNHHLSVPFLF